MKENDKNQNGRDSVSNSDYVENLESQNSLSALPPPDPFSTPIQKKQNNTKMPDGVKDKMESTFNEDFSNVKIHANSQSATDVNALAYTQGSDVHFAPGQFKPDSSQGQEILGHELAHVVQQKRGNIKATTEAAGMPVNDDTHLEAEADTMGRKAAQMKSGQSDSNYKNTGSIPTRGSQILQGSSSQPIQRIVASQELADGKMEVNMPRQAAPSAGLTGNVKFTPNKTAPYSNKIGLIQIVKLTDAKGANVNPASMPATGQGDPKTGVRTDADKKGGVDGGYYTDILHNDFLKFRGGGVTKKGAEQLPYYELGTGGLVGQVFGFKRSNEAADMKTAVIGDAPGGAGNFDFSFETVAKGDDNMHVYGAAKWAFKIRKGKGGKFQVQSETSSFTGGASATFEAALDKHREFYVHEPLTLYFDTNSPDLNATERAKLLTVKQYLADHTDVKMRLTGFSDVVGGEKYNQGLALRRAQSVKGNAVADLGVANSRISSVTQGGETTKFTDDANAGRGQRLEANLRGNRRVMVEFEHTTTPAPKKGP